MYQIVTHYLNVINKEATQKKIWWNPPRRYRCLRDLKKRQNTVVGRTLYPAPAPLVLGKFNILKYSWVFPRSAPWTFVNAPVKKDEGKGLTLGSK